MGCREHKDKRELIRIVRLPDDGGVTVDFKGKMNGRGAYVCPDEKCLKRVRKTGAAARTLGVTIPPEVWDEAIAAVTANAANAAVAAK
jgi:predicted RNA-binding protein YlxR (DUF448 family)